MRIKHRKILWLVSRALFLLLVALWMNFAFFRYLKDATTIKYGLNQDKKISSRSTLVDLSGFSEDISSFVKVPVSLLRFNIYARNDVWGKKRDEKVPTLLNVQILGNYINEIETGKVRQISKETIDISEIQNQNFLIETSFKINSGDEDATPSNLPEESLYYFYIEPTTMSFLFTWLAFVVLTNTLLIPVSSCFKFVLIGSPFFEVFSEFKKKNE